MEGSVMTSTSKSSKQAEPQPEPVVVEETGWPRAVRTTFQPGRDITVTATEYAELKAQGVLLEKGK